MTQVRSELWTALQCDSGQRIDAGGFFMADLFTTTNSIDGTPSVKYRIPTTRRNSDAIAAINEGQITRIWRSDSDYEEWPIGPIVRTKGKGGDVSVTCRPLLWRLGDCGIVTEYDPEPSNGFPQVDVGVAQLTLTEIIQKYVIDHPVISAILPWLTIGTIDPTKLIDLHWQWAPPLQVIRMGLEAVQSSTQLYELQPLRRVGTTAYAIDILGV